MAGATAFFTTFALPPIVFILAQLFGMFIGQRNMGQALVERISDTIGPQGAEQVRQVLRSIRGFNDSWYMIVGGFIFLVFVSTSLFSVIKNSLDQIWGIRVKKNPGLLFILSIRLRSFSVILLVGILFMADLLFESLEIIAGQYVEAIWKGGGVYLKSVLREVVSVIIEAAWFILLFRFLADARPSWKASVIGGLLTGILFIAGRWILKTLLVNSSISELYGASGSFVLVLLFVFYSSFILYYGACFIAVYSGKKQWPIRPTDKAFDVKKENIIT